MGYSSTGSWLRPRAVGSGRDTAGKHGRQEVGLPGPCLSAWCSLCSPQYPGGLQSINSDVNNLMTVLNMSNMLQKVCGCCWARAGVRVGCWDSGSPWPPWTPSSAQACSPQHLDHGCCGSWPWSVTTSGGRLCPQVQVRSSPGPPPLLPLRGQEEVEASNAEGWKTRLGPGVGAPSPPAGGREALGLEGSALAVLRVVSRVGVEIRANRV